MRWLEGWFGTASGALGIVLMALVALLVPAQTASYSSVESCSPINGVESCSTQYGPGGPPSIQPNYGALILIALALLIFIGVLVGTWLDLGGRRLIGRIILLTSATLLIVALFVSGLAFAGESLSVAIFAYPLALMGIVAGIVACVRRDEPRATPVAAPAPTPPETPS